MVLPWQNRRYPLRQPPRILSSVLAVLPRTDGNLIAQRTYYNPEIASQLPSLFGSCRPAEKLEATPTRTVYYFRRRDHRGLDSSCAGSNLAEVEMLS
jgi:hypothetical protein